MQKNDALQNVGQVENGVGVIAGHRAYAPGNAQRQVELARPPHFHQQQQQQQQQSGGGQQASNQQRGQLMSGVYTPTKQHQGGMCCLQATNAFESVGHTTPRTLLRQTIARIKQSETMVFDSRAKHTAMMVVLQSKLVSRELLSPSFMSAQVLPLQCLFYSFCWTTRCL
jgi:hypothetical protein